MVLPWPWSILERQQQNNLGRWNYWTQWDGKLQHKLKPGHQLKKALMIKEP